MYVQMEKLHLRYKMHADYRQIKCWFPEAGYAQIGKGWIGVCDAENKRDGNSFFWGATPSDISCWIVPMSAIACNQ